MAVTCSQVGALDGILMPDLQALLLPPSAGREAPESFAPKRVMEKGQGLILGVITPCLGLGAKLRPL